MNESDFLAHEAAEARAAMVRAAGDLSRNAAVALSPRMWVKEHPWATIGLPTLGFGSVATLMSFLFLHKKKRHGGGWLSRLFGHESESAPPPVAKKTWWMLILEQLIFLVRPAILSTVAAVFSSRFAHHRNGQAGNSGQVR